MKDLFDSLNKESKQEKKEFKKNKLLLEEMISSIKKYHVRNTCLNDYLAVFNFNNGLSMVFYNDFYCLVPPTLKHYSLLEDLSNEHVLANIYNTKTWAHEKNTWLEMEISSIFPETANCLTNILENGLFKPELEIAKKKDLFGAAKNVIDLIKLPYDTYNTVNDGYEIPFVKCLVYPFAFIWGGFELSNNIITKAITGYPSGGKFKCERILSKKKNQKNSSYIGLNFIGTPDNFKKIYVDIVENDKINAHFEIKADAYSLNGYEHQPNYLEYKFNETTDYGIFPNQRDYLEPEYFLNQNYFQSDILSRLYGYARYKEDLWHKWRIFNMQLNKENILYLKNLGEEK